MPLPCRRYYKYIPKMQMYEVSSANLFKKLVVLATLMMLGINFCDSKNLRKNFQRIVITLWTFLCLISNAINTKKQDKNTHNDSLCGFEMFLKSCLIKHSFPMTHSHQRHSWHLKIVRCLLFCWVTSHKILLSSSIGFCTDMSLQLIAYHNLAFSSPSISTLVLLSLNF